MPIGGKDAFLSKVTFRRESNWYSKTKQMLKDMESIEERAEASVTFKKVGGDLADNDVFIHNIHAEGKRVGYIQGAKEQKELDDKLAFEEREKAFKAGYDTAIRYACDALDDVYFPSEEAREKAKQIVRKAMEEV